MSKCKSDGRAAGSPARAEIVCTLVVDNMFDEFEVEIRFQRTDGVDRAFATDKDLVCLRAERPSEFTLAYSVKTLLFDIIWRCLHYVGEPVDVRAGLLGKERVEAIINSVRLEMEEVKKENEVWREARNRNQGRPIGTFANGLNSRRRNLDRTLSRDEPHPPNAAKAKSVLLWLLQSQRRHRRTRRVRCPEEGVQLAEEPELTS